MRSTIKAWIEANADNIDWPERDSTRRNRHGYRADIPWDQLPTLVFPIEVLTEDGEMLTVEDRAELAQLKMQCRKDFYGGRCRHGHHRGDRCFELVFPITLILPDETTITASDRDDLKTQLRAWREANPDVEGRPTLQYPVTVQLEDESTVTVNSKDELKDLKESCSED